MVQSFAGEVARDAFRSRNTSYARQLPKNLWRGAQRKL